MSFTYEKLSNDFLFAQFCRDMTYELYSRMSHDLPTWYDGWTDDGYDYPDEEIEDPDYIPSHKDGKDVVFQVKREKKVNDVYRLAMKKHRNEMFKQNKVGIMGGGKKSQRKWIKVKKSQIDLSSEY